MAMPKTKASSRHTARGAKVSSGGGARLNKVKNVRQGSRETPRVRAANVKAVSELGYSRGNHATNTGDFPFKREQFYEGKSFQPVPMGNTLTVDKKPGPGAGRNVYPTSTQCQHGPAVKGVSDYAPDVPATKPGRDILRDYGPESK